MSEYYSSQTRESFKHGVERYIDVISRICKFSILVLGERQSGKTTLIKTALLDLSNEENTDDNQDEFQITCGESPVTFIEYRGPMSSRADIEAFHSKFRGLCRQYNCLICWNTSKSLPDNCTKRLLRDLKTRYAISSIIVFTNLLDNMPRMMQENPSTYNAECISWIPSISQRVEGYDLNMSLYDIFCHTKELIHPAYGNTIDMLMANREIDQNTVNVEEYEKFQLGVAHDMARELEIEMFNLMLIGPSGAGKSTLINALLKTSRAYVDNVSPATMYFEEYQIENSPITLVDSRGFEHERFDEIKLSIDQEIDARSAFDSRRIHMIWYCVRTQSHRFVDEEFRMVEEWRNKGIPVFLLVTNASEYAELDYAIREQRGYPSYQDLIDAEDKQAIIEKRVVVTKILAKRATYIDHDGRKVHVAPYGIQRLIDLMKYYLPEEKKYIHAQMKQNLNPNLSPIIRAMGKANVDMINIMVIGDSGAGKSQLIKVIFGLQVESNVGRSVTNEIKQYMVPNKPLSIYDTVGFEYGLNQMIKGEIIDTITSKAYEENPSKHIHIVWYVINHGRERIEENDIKNILEIRNHGIPIIIVLNNAPLGNSAIIKSIMDGKVGEIKVPDSKTIIDCREDDRKDLISKKIAVIKTNAKETYNPNRTKVTVPVYGTNELVQLTQFYIDVAAANALHTSIVNYDRKHSHVMRAIIPKYKDELKNNWVLSLSFRQTIFDNIFIRMLTEIMSTYNFNWSATNVRRIQTSLYRDNEKFHKKSDKITGGIWFFNAFFTRSDASNLIGTSGRIISESFKSLIARYKGKDLINVDKFIEEVKNMFDLESDD